MRVLLLLQSPPPPKRLRRGSRPWSPLSRWPRRRRPVQVSAASSASMPCNSPQLAAQLPHLLARRGGARRHRRGRCFLPASICSRAPLRSAEGLQCYCSALGQALGKALNGAHHLTNCETVKGLIRLWPSFGPRVKPGPLRDLSYSSILSRIAPISIDDPAAAMLPVRDFRRRRRRRATLGQPLIGFWLAALLAHAAAQPHAREHHAQHIMNQARAHQKACGCSVSSQSRRARSAERHAVEQYITSHRWRAGLDNVAEWRRVAVRGAHTRA